MSAYFPEIEVADSPSLIAALPSAVDELLEPLFRIQARLKNTSSRKSRVSTVG